MKRLWLYEHTGENIVTWIGEMLSDFTVGTNKVAAFTHVVVHMPF